MMKRLDHSCYQTNKLNLYGSSAIFGHFSRLNPFRIRQRILPIFQGREQVNQVSGARFESHEYPVRSVVIKTKQGTDSIELNL